MNGCHPLEARRKEREMMLDSTSNSRIYYRFCESSLLIGCSLGRVVRVVCCNYEASSWGIVVVWFRRIDLINDWGWTGARKVDGVQPKAFINQTLDD